MANSRTTLPLLLASLLLLQAALGAQAAFGEPVDKDRRAAIVAEQGPGAPFGEWHVRNEAHRFYLHVPAGYSTGSGTGVAAPPATVVFGANLNYPSAPASEAADRAVVIGSNERHFSGCVDTLVLGRACQNLGNTLAYQFATFRTRDTTAIPGNPSILNQTVFAVEGRMFVAGLPTNGLVYARLFQVDAAGARVGSFAFGGTQNPAGTAPNGAAFYMAPQGGIQAGAERTPGPIEYFGRVLFGVDGFRLPAGHSFEFEVGTATADPTNPVDPQGMIFGSQNIEGQLPGSPGVLLLDTEAYPSAFTVVSDAARINLWTETRQGNPSNAFAPANIDANTPSNVADRQFLVQVVQANAWGRHGFDPNPSPPTNGGRADTFCGERSGLNPIFTSFTGRHALRMFAPDGTQLDIRSATPDLQTGTLQTGGAGTGAGFKELDPAGVLLQKTWHFVYPSGFEGSGAQAVPKAPDGTYRIEAYNDCYQWRAATHDFIVGKREFEFTLALGESTPHSTLIGQATEFAFRIRNAGASADTFQFAVPNLQGFTAVFSRASITLQPGEEQIVTLRLTPPGSVGNGDSRTFTVTAASLLTNQIKTVSVAQTFTNVPLKGVEVFSAKSIVETRPGLTSAISIAVKNTGNSAERFLVRATGAPLGWSVSASPVTLDLPAASRGDVLLQVTAPRDAVSGTAFTLQVEAVSAADAANRAALNLPVTVFLVRAVDIEPTIGATAVTLRNKGAENCSDLDSCLDPLGVIGGSHSDTDVDRTSLVRYKLKNSGDLPATYSLKVYWDPAVKTSDCGNTPDGVPDAWRFNVDKRSVPDTTLPDLGTAPGGSPQVGERRAPGFSGLISIGTLALQPREAKDVVLEVGYSSDESACSGTQSSNTARIVLQVTDPLDPTFIEEQGTSFERVAAGNEVVQNRFSGGQRAVAVVNETNERVRHFTPSGAPTTYRIVAKNLGNEMDTLTVKLDAGKAGWTHTLRLDPNIGDKYLFNGANPNGDAGGTAAGTLDEEPTLAGCPVSGNPRQVSCTLGVRDEIHLLVDVTPPQGVQTGSRDFAIVTVVSQDDGNKFDDIVLESVVGGLFTYQVTSPVTQLDVVRGQQALFPYTINNIGESADTVRVTVEGPASWQPTLSDPSGQAFLQPGGVQHGFLRVQAPASAPLNQAQRFLLKFENAADPEVAGDSTFRVLEFFAQPTEGGTLSLSAPPVLVPRSGPANLPVRVQDLTGSASNVKVWIEDARLPDGWSVNVAGSANNETLAPFQTDDNATITFQVSAPSDALSTSRVPLRIFGQAGGVTRFIDTEAVLASVFGVTLNATAAKVVTAPAVQATHTIRITNTGLDRDTYTIATSTPPSGWNVTVPQPSLGVEPLESKDFVILVTPPAGAAPGTTGTVLVFASSAGDATKTAQTALLTEVGVRRPQVFAPVGANYAAPQETATLVFEVLNNGTLADTLTLTAVLAPEIRDQAVVTISNATVALSPSRSEDVLVRVTLPRTIQAGSVIPVTLRATAAGASPPSSEATAAITVLGHSLRDVDGDLLIEMAVDRDRNATNGFEQFVESPSVGGVTTAPADLERFLSEAARARMGTPLRYTAGEHCAEPAAAAAPIDGDCDGKADFLLDTNADGMPDAYFDPDLPHAHAVNVSKDVTGDQVREVFVDTTGDGVLDHAFDVREASFIPLLSRDVDGDGRSDYVVDLDRDGQADPEEPVVVSRSGGLVTLTRVDVDGNGQLDEVYDFDGDGNPESFVPAGKTQAYAITLRDVTGDGIDDWTYDADGDGRVDSYYDPATGQVGLIDERSSFMRALRDHWYIGALFGLVLVLFVVLLLVTRK